ncbi:WXG100 family type VII secretion target [Paenibacillus andongensis]|uniref:WXG100 family type VII secretion target n=1 Tax=Paenibacillus andongensis TaxID=2975482 RepID=UPI0021BA7214|nr:WXG100 family type VII secretion target [Paenibacillus andongensis]
MANNSMRVETTDLRNSAKLIEDKTGKYVQEYSKIYNDVIANLKVNWQGQSSEAFNRQIEGYRNDFDELATVLKSYSDFLVKTADKIEKTEDALKNAASNLNSGR